MLKHVGLIYLDVFFLSTNCSGKRLSKKIKSKRKTTSENNSLHPIL